MLKQKGGVGIINIKTRAELYDGRVDIVSSPGNVYELKVELSMLQHIKKSKTIKAKPA